MDSPSTTPRRSARIQNLSPPSVPDLANGAPSTSPMTKIMAARRSPFIPTYLETIVLSIYPATLVVGSLFALLDPVARSAPYNTVTQSHYASTAPSYFAKKSNVFNLFFVKQGWAWVTFSYFFFLFTHPSTGPTSSFALTPKRIRGILRYGILTLWWIFVTQWFFGPPIIDRGFLLTGGQCDLVELAEAGKVDMDDTRQFITGVACKAVGGKWKGGHDISGHVFLLVLGSMFIFEEVLHVVLRSVGANEERTIFMNDGAVKSAEVEAERVTPKESGQWTLGAKIVLGVAALSLYMLLMTAAYFHTWFEKLTGLLVALSGIFVVYFLPRVIPALRGVIGMPGAALRIVGHLTPVITYHLTCVPGSHYGTTHVFPWNLCSLFILSVDMFGCIMGLKPTLPAGKKSEVLVRALKGYSQCLLFMLITRATPNIHLDSYVIAIGKCNLVYVLRIFDLWITVAQDEVVDEVMTSPWEDIGTGLGLRRSVSYVGQHLATHMDS